MKKPTQHHSESPNFILQNQGILHTFQKSVRDFYTRNTDSIFQKHPQQENQDFLIIDNDTGEIIKA